MPSVGLRVVPLVATWHQLPTQLRSRAEPRNMHRDAPAGSRAAASEARPPPLQQAPPAPAVRGHQHAPVEGGRPGARQLLSARRHAAQNVAHRPAQQAQQAGTRYAVASGSPPTAAAISRLVSSGAPGRLLSRGVAGAPWRVLGPVAWLLLVVAGLAAVALGALRTRVRAVRACAACRGYGVQRCKLCAGCGTIVWEGKLTHEEPCPRCLGCRSAPCATCGGAPPLGARLFGRRRFRSRASGTGGGGGSGGDDSLQQAWQGKLARPWGSSARSGVAAATRGGGGKRSRTVLRADQDFMQESDAFAGEVMSD